MLVALDRKHLRLPAEVGVFIELDAAVAGGPCPVASRAFRHRPLD
jgi:hypothetical protein